MHRFWSLAAGIALMTGCADSGIFEPAPETFAIAAATVAAHDGGAAPVCRGMPATIWEPATM